ncbi:hypothetical protein PR202_ga06195 [Eleusine coracana subsp. coracana]|uniref:Protein transport protein sec16 n=1 Tax=Eleusine coracana subsp. coracana TaxID=191504 RepID=A0AAV5BWL9_ELECO|nr:hypothetical protein PR202_ga06195 [Eleusine coracana subsp. coracana]
MASADDQTDADFFDKLVDDDDQAPLPANDELPEAAALPRAVSSISLADDGPGAPDPSAPEAVSVPEGGSPASGKGTGVHTAVKQVQWASFGGDDDGPDPFADLAGDDGFLGNMAALDTSAAATSGASDHAVLAAEVTDQDFFGGSPNHNAADRQPEHSASGAVDSTDPKYFETMYPGWKYDQATQQWYQVETSGNAQQQPNDASYLQNSALETIAEEGTTTATTSSWASEYPPNMLFYAEYPGWYFDTNTQQWHSLESYQQAAVQPGTASALQNATNYSVTAPSAAMDYNANQTDNNQVAQHNSFMNSYTHQNQGQGQVDAFANTMQSETVADGSLTSSFYGFDQQANAESISSSTSHQVGFNSLEDHHKGLESSSLQSGYNSTDTQQSIYNTFEPSTSFQASYKGLEPAMGHQTSHHVSEQSTSNQEGYKAFQPSLGNQSDYKAFEPSSGHHAGYKGFMPSTGSQAGYKGSETSTVHQAAYKGFETSSDQQVGYMASQPSSDQISSYTGFETSANHGYADVNGVLNAQGFVSKESMYHGQKQANAYQQGHLSNSFLGTENSMNFTQQQFFGAHASNMQFGPSPHEGRSSAGRPPHAIVSFGFGGKLIVMKESSPMATNFSSGNQGNSGGAVSVLNLSEVVDKADQASSTNSGVLSYFHALCHQPVPGPLVGGSASSKDVNKWLDEMIAWYESSASDFQRGDTRKLLISLLKILCQHYGKLRSPFGSDPQEFLGEERKLFSVPREVNFGDLQSYWLYSLVISFIVLPVLVVQFYVDTVKKMAHSHFVSGSPLRTLCLLIAGQPADVFTVENNINSDYATLGASHQSMEPGPNGMLEDWEENLAIITANRTKGDDLVITHLGDCLWKEKYEVAAAHSCYLVAELNIDSYSESARLCLIGADHLKCPRTYVSPEAIQRTEVYEYAKVLGNSQYILLPFQPYKLIYAYMLAEVGRISDSLRYCQASMKVLKASGRAPELETWKQLFSSLEERIRTHQQGGYGTNLAPAKLVGKIFTSLDKSISRMMGTPSAPLPPLPQGSVTERESYSAPAAAKFGNSQSVMAMSSLMPSASMQSMSEITENSNGGTGRKIAHNRSVSEPDFGRTPKQGAGSDGTQSSASGSGSSRFGWLGSTLQKTMELVSKSHRQAKLGDQNKFYYDEKLKRWVEEGAAISAEEPPLPPPPSKSSFQNGLADHKFLNGPMSGSHAPNGVTEWKSSNSSEHGLGMPPVPPGQNQFSARGRMGVRSRYVDTFNKAGVSGAVPSYNKPAAPSVAPPAGAKFFMPTAAAASADQMSHQAAEIQSETMHHDERSASPAAETSFCSPLPSAQFSAPMSSTIHRHPSMDNISTPYQGSGVSAGSNSSSFSKSRAASWSGTYSEQFSAIAGARSPDGQTMPLPVMPGRPSHSRSNSNSSVQFNGLTEDLHEVEL